MFSPSDSETDSDKSDQALSDDNNQIVINEMQDSNEIVENWNLVTPSDGVVFWNSNSQQFTPRFFIPNKAVSTSNLPRQYTEVDIFLKIFSNQKIYLEALPSALTPGKNYLKRIQKKRFETDYHKIMVILKISFVMCCNHVPEFSNY